MRITNELSDQAVLEELGTRVAQRRIRGNLTQEELAQEAGVARKTLTRMERGLPVQTPSLMRVLRVLGALENCDVLVPETSVSPIQSLKLQGRQRQRASRKATKPKQRKPWKWSEEI